MKSEKALTERCGQTISFHIKISNESGKGEGWIRSGGDFIRIELEGGKIQGGKQNRDSRASMTNHRWMRGVGGLPSPLKDPLIVTSAWPKPISIYDQSVAHQLIIGLFAGCVLLLFAVLFAQLIMQFLIQRPICRFFRRQAQGASQDVHEPLPPLGRFRHSHIPAARANSKNARSWPKSAGRPAPIEHQESGDGKFQNRPANANICGSDHKSISILCICIWWLVQHETLTETTNGR